VKKIKILQLITGLGMGGAEKVVLNLSKYISRKDFDIYVVGLSKRDELLEEFIKNNIKTKLLRKSNSFRNFIKIIFILNKFVKQQNIDIIHAHMTHSCIVASVLKILNPNVKVVFTSHSFNVGSKFREVILWTLKYFRDIDIVFSQEIVKFFYKSNYKIIPNGIKIDKYNLNLQKNKKFTFISIGRLENVKNHKFLIKIINELKEDFDFELQIVGDGYLRKDLENLIKRYNLENYVKLLGLRNDVPYLLNKAHCLLMPSLWEGLPIVILEAGASKLPVISTPVGSIPSLLNNENSYLVDLKDFKKAMIDVMNNYDIAKKKGEKLFEKIKNHYSVEFMVKEHEKLYKEIVK
jgi:glycosyltransferase involved in cell wall biosynthesis